MWTWNWIEYWTYSESYFLNCFASPWGPTQLCQIVSNHEYVSCRGKKWILVSWWNQYLGGIKISCSDKYAAILFPSQATNLDMCGQSHSASIHLDTEYVHYWSKVREVFFHYSFVAFNSHNVGIADIFWGEALCQNMLENAFFFFCQLWLFKSNRQSLPFLTVQMFDFPSLKFYQT